MNDSERHFNRLAQVRLGEALLKVGLSSKKANLQELQALRSAYIARIVRLRQSKGYGYDPRSPKGKPTHDEIASVEKLLERHIEPRLQALYGDWLVAQVRETFARVEEVPPRR